MTALVDLMQQYPLLTLAYWFVLAGSFMDFLENREASE